VARRFYVRTFGCQMNAHDSERIAGLLASEGMEPTEDVEDADVVVLNTCCIREHADERLYGHLGALKSLKARRPSMQIAVAGCLAQKDRAGILERAPHVDVVVGTFNVARTAALLRDAVDGPQVEVWEAPTDSAPTPFLWPTPSRRPGGAGTPPGSPSRSAATTPAASASSRPSGVRR
jgi:tRNA-2-methylthio-N6-dimethylallyladenosine synthase